MSGTPREALQDQDQALATPWMSTVNSLAPPCMAPLSSCGWNEYLNLPKCKVTFSVRRSSPPLPPVDTEVTSTPSESSIVRKSVCSPVALVMYSQACSTRAPVQQASSSALEQPSTYFVMEMSCTCALPPLAEPPPVCRSPELLTPHAQARIGTSPLCFLWLDAPSLLTLPAPNLMCMSNAMKPSPYVRDGCSIPP